ncbi:MAG: hypothetical protein WKF48_00315 [Solirubrobacteraceae bacterium]
MSEHTADEETDRGLVASAISTTMLGNSSAFGFSITITGSFGMLQVLRGTPTALEILLFGVAAAAMIGVVQGVVTRGFRAHPVAVPTDTRLLGTAQDFFSVAAGLGAAFAVGSIVHRGVAWPIAGCLASIVFLAAESAEIVVAELVKRERGRWS